MRTSRKNFEIYLFRHFSSSIDNGQNLGKDMFKESLSKDGKLVHTNVTLYYLNDQHVASWSNGKGNIFDK